jgi:predicted MFS family arabinose efflux permease
MTSQADPTGSAAEQRVVLLAGLVQGITLVTFPAASSILTGPDGYDLSSSQYGALFLPQVVTAIAASLLGSRLAVRITTKRVLLLGLAANLASMVILVLSTAVSGDVQIAYPLLLLATALLGAGFGLTVPVLNVLVAAFRPDRADRAVLMLNALLGLGTATAPVFVAIFVGLGFWWGLPVLSALLLSLLIAATVRQPLLVESGGGSAGGGRSGRLPGRFWLFAAFAVLYGICETMNGNWSQLDLTTQVGASRTQASLALTCFWAMVTLGRLVFAGVERWLPSRVVYHVLPVLLVASFTLTAALSEGQAALGIAVFAVAGLGCSALLPLTISFGQGALTSMTAAVPGAVIACYQLGYGVAAFGVGPLVDSGTSLSDLFGYAAVVAGVMAVLSFAVTHRPRSSRHTVQVQVAGSDDGAA